MLIFREEDYNNKAFIANFWGLLFGSFLFSFPFSFVKGATSVPEDLQVLKKKVLIVPAKELVGRN